ncbi:peptidoglycan DD-metalloendopeptidase family protein [Radiobacillus sp. PE A8.2]|uniref:peptidoglycan DD-metalloendopeptidase family protein n=1 Tax=Radiobacillus sp. PE A8.2 TaxID=3380349 RepID=UPI00388F8FA5
MKEENNNVSENTWKRIFRKKWFFPAVYLTIAALLLSGVLWYQNVANQVPEADNRSETEDEILRPSNDRDQDASPVMDPQEVVQMPVREESQTEIVTKFYDYEADSEDKEKALVLFDNTYYQSDGVDIAQANGESFDVTAALSGTVTEVKEDPILGNVVKIEHQDNVTTNYASLGEVLVEQGAEVKQGDKIGTAGQNLFGQDIGTHVHFQVRKDGTAVNPESFFNQPVSAVALPQVDDEGDDSDSEEDETEDEDDSKEEDASSTSTESSAAMANA